MLEQLITFCGVPRTRGTGGVTGRGARSADELVPGRSGTRQVASPELCPVSVPGARRSTEYLLRFGFLLSRFQSIRFCMILALVRFGLRTCFGPCDLKTLDCGVGGCRAITVQAACARADADASPFGVNIFGGELTDAVRYDNFYVVQQQYGSKLFSESID
ncbi:hypothetical protein EVAR_34487_1 [Eumeta japonica]|uniref:Uncharacterized protein n=1 Tax=Eumeta variegata TaxID=151549 RepID=A0A4C1WWJ3_EUMVA|nr:hypothetical protein EVAR_34487_1 [Eumeta japonica]